MNQMVDYSDTYDPDLDFDRHYTLATARAIATRVEPGQSVLELGCATGLMSEAIISATSPARWVGVERSASYLERARARRIAAEFVRGDLDELDRSDLGSGWDHVLITNVLHEVKDPAALLNWAGGALAEGGQIHVTLQNPESIHRVCAVELGMIDDVKAVSDRGLQWGTRGLWSAADLSVLAGEVGLDLLAREGVMLKPLPNSAMATLSDEVIEGFIRAARHFPDHCAMNYLVLG